MMGTQKQVKEKIKENMKDVGYAIAVLSGKGGVGKSTVAVNLAAALSEKHSVGLLDCDITGPNIPLMLGIQDERLKSRGEGIKPVDAYGLKVVSTAFLLENRDTPVIWRGPMKGNVIGQFLAEVEWGKLDYLIIDLPPGTGDEALTTVQLLEELDGVVVVTTPQDVSLLDSKKAVNFARQLETPVLGVIENMSGLKCPHCAREINLFKQGGGEKASIELKIPFLGGIPLEPGIVISCDEGKPFIKDAGNSSHKSFREVVENIQSSLNK